MGTCREMSSKAESEEVPPAQQQPKKKKRNPFENVPAEQEAWIRDNFVLEEKERVWLVLSQTLGFWYYTLAILWYVVCVVGVGAVALFIHTFPNVLPFGLAAFAHRGVVFGVGAAAILSISYAQLSAYLEAVYTVYVFTNVRFGNVYWRHGPPGAFVSVRFDTVAGTRADFDSHRFGSVSFNEVVCVKPAAEVAKEAEHETGEYGQYAVVKHFIHNIPEADDMSRVINRLINETKTKRESS